MAEFDLGILIIGSLFWDTKGHRKRWRRDRLVCDRATSVGAPIRYGRISESRDNTYTMVFSNALVPNNLGRALAVTCIKRPASVADLFNEAESLWAAEQPSASKSRLISGSWGAVGLLRNPHRPLAEEIIAGWTRRIRTEEERTESKYCSNLVQSPGETPVVNPDGFLTIPWPDTKSGHPLELDALLATVTVPSLCEGDYAGAEKIAEAWNSIPKRRNYFDENRSVGITTAADEQILLHLQAPPTQNDETLSGQR